MQKKSLAKQDSQKNSQKVYSLVKKIPKGRVITYKEIAKKLKQNNLNLHPRAIAKILAKNKNLIKIPCHRVIYSSGNIGGYVSGTKNKIRILKKEGIEIIKNNKIDLKEFMHKFK